MSDDLDKEIPLSLPPPPPPPRKARGRPARPRGPKLFDGRADIKEDTIKRIAGQPVCGSCGDVGVRLNQHGVIERCDTCERYGNDHLAWLSTNPESTDSDGRRKIILPSTEVQAAIDKVTKVVHDELQPNDVVQIVSGDNIGVLIQVGKIDGDTIKGYQIQPHGDRPLIDCKIAETAKIGKSKKAWKYPESDEVPTWHETRPLPQ